MLKKHSSIYNVEEMKYNYTYFTLDGRKCVRLNRQTSFDGLAHLFDDANCSVTTLDKIISTWLAHDCDLYLVFSAPIHDEDIKRLQYETLKMYDNMQPTHDYWMNHLRISNFLVGIEVYTLEEVKFNVAITYPIAP